MDHTSFYMSYQGILYEELKFRFFRKFKSKPSPANQYGFFDDTVVDITSQFIESKSLGFNADVFVYAYYENKILKAAEQYAVEYLVSKLEENMSNKSLNVVYVFDINFKRLVALLDDELENKIFLKEIN